MKRKLGIAMAVMVAVASIGLLAADGPDLDKLARGHIAAMQQDGSITNVVNLLMAGEVCRIRGHSWGPHMHLTLEYSPSRVGCRECKVCGLHQSQYASEWK